MEELLHPVLLLSYDLHSSCTVTCHIRYLYTTSEDDLPWKTRYEALENDHKRLSDQYLSIQSSLYHSANTDIDLLQVTTENEALKTELAKEKQTVVRLNSKLREREARKSKAEVLLAQTETRCKDLLSLNTGLEKRLSDLERTCKETSYRAERDKETLEACSKTLSQRDEQVKKLLLRIKQQENALETLQEELKKRESMYFSLNRRLKDANPVLKPNSILENQLKEVKNRLQERETELEILKEMMKNAQKVRDRGKQTVGVRLPLIRTANTQSPPRRPGKVRGGREGNAGKIEKDEEKSSKSQLVLGEDYSDLPEVDVTGGEEGTSRVIEETDV